MQTITSLMKAFQILTHELDQMSHLYFSIYFSSP